MQTIPSQNDPFVDWTKDAEGMITIFPLAGYGTATFAGMGGMLRVEFVRTLDQLGKQHESLQLGMTLDQAKELGEALLKMASQLDLSVPSKSARN